MKLHQLAKMRFTKYGLPLWLLGSVVLGMAIAGVSICLPAAGKASVDEPAVERLSESNEAIQPIQPLTDLDPRKVELGRTLFEDPRLSHNDQVACVSCHDLTTGGTDRRARSIGINGAVGAINSPTVFNSVFNFSQFWDGRAETLESQIDGPILSKVEMGSNWPEIVAKLKNFREYVQPFHQIYGDGIQPGNIKDSIASFERSLVTPNSRFDRYLRHEVKTLTSDERQGYALFTSFGCASCHQGKNVGGNMYQKLGVMAPYFTDRGHITVADRGRFNVTGDALDLYMFKVPSLRNVALTAPYFHDGSQATLADAVLAMAKYQLGRQLSDHEVSLMVEFLKTLTGELNGTPL